MCNNKQKITTREQVWDDKFGMIEREVPVQDCAFYKNDGNCGYNMPDTLQKCIHPDNQAECMGYLASTKTPVGCSILDGVGKDAEVVTNANGGKQSKAAAALYLLDPQWLHDWAENLQSYAQDSTTANYYNAIIHISFYMMEDATEAALDTAMYYLEENELQQVIKIGKVLQEGAEKYSVNNWRLIPREEHINHALIHIVAHLMGDTQDEHIDHALCRLMMAQATQESEGFSYTKCTSNMTNQKV